MKRIYHPYHLWEDYKAGFYNNISGEQKKECIKKVVEMFSNPELTNKYMTKVITEWVYSCEHNLTNDALNKIAYLGQGACCLYCGASSSVTMEAWHLVPQEFRTIADAIAKDIIDKYKPIKREVQLCLKLN